MQRGLFHIRVYEQHALSLAVHGKCDIGRDRALALVFHDRGHHDDLAVILAHEVFDARAQLFEGLGKGKARCGVCYEYALFLSSEAVAEILVLFLVIHGGEHFRVELRLDLADRFYRIAHICPRADKQCRSKRRSNGGKLCIAHRTCGVHRCRRHGRALQNIERDVFQNYRGKLLVVSEYSLCDVIRLTGAFRRDAHL